MECFTSSELTLLPHNSRKSYKIITELQPNYHDIFAASEWKRNFANFLVEILGVWEIFATICSKILGKCIRKYDVNERAHKLKQKCSNYLIFIAYYTTGLKGKVRGQLQRTNNIYIKEKI